MNYKRKSRRQSFLLMRSRIPPISSKFRGGLNTPPPVRHCYRLQKNSWGYGSLEINHVVALGPAWAIQPVEVEEELEEKETVIT